jgi:hypothetical protein
MVLSRVPWDEAERERGGGSLIELACGDVEAATHVVISRMCAMSKYLLLRKILVCH